MSFKRAPGCTPLALACSGPMPFWQHINTPLDFFLSFFAVVIRRHAVSAGHVPAGGKSVPEYHFHNRLKNRGFDARAVAACVCLQFSTVIPILLTSERFAKWGSQINRIAKGLTNSNQFPTSSVSHAHMRRSVPPEMQRAAIFSAFAAPVSSWLLRVIGRPVSIRVQHVGATGPLAGGWGMRLCWRNESLDADGTTARRSLKATIAVQAVRFFERQKRKRPIRRMENQKPNRTQICVHG